MMRRLKIDNSGRFRVTEKKTCKSLALVPIKGIPLEKPCAFRAPFQGLSCKFVLFNLTYCLLFMPSDELNDYYKSLALFIEKRRLKMINEFLRCNIR